MTGSRGNRIRTLGRTTCLLPFLLICGCAAFPALETSVSRPDAPVTGDNVDPASGTATDAAPGTQPERLRIPTGSAPVAPSRLPATAAQIDALVSDDLVDANLAPQSVPQFAATVFGGLLSVPYTLTADVSTRPEIISGGTGGTLTKRNLFRLTQQALRQYGIEVYIEGGFVTVGASQTSDIGASLTRGRESTDGAGRVVQFFPVQTIEVSAIQGLLTDLFPNLGGARITVDQLSNSLIISGSSREVQQVVRVLREIDQPRFAGADVLRVEPVYVPPEALASALENALVTEGYIVSRQALAGRSIVILSFPSSSQLLIFTKDPVLLARVEFWLQQLDRPAVLGDKSSTFVYEVRNTDAQSLGQLAMGQAPSANTAPTPVGVPGRPPATGIDGAQPTVPGVQSTGTQGAAGQYLGGRILVDTSSNRILFTGTATDFASLRQLLRTLDTPAPQVAIEVMVAEVTLTDETSLGVNLFGTEVRGDGIATGGTEGIDLGGAGLLLTFTGPEFRAALNAQASNNRVNILQRPQLVTRSGVPARFQVGTDVPIITSQRATDFQSGNNGSDVLQSVQYRQTGVILELTPVVYGDRVDIIVNQEISEVGQDAIPGISSPTILNRSVSTQIAIADGWTGVLGGLISNSYSKGNSGVPFLKDIPIVGSAFQNNTVEGRRTELLILITPRIIRGNEDMADLADSLSRDMDAAFRTGRGWSYTLTPFSVGPAIRGIGIDLPSSSRDSERPPLFPRSEPASETPEESPVTQ
ncbi:secretin N-terminal domain-containing protein [Brevundimonas variabilis]|uniref:General secretion pathway protein D n=1 Tax=Brevundimonas variabilis TaxID=74312 RepID=A0A7W9CGQ4_9CAUL|nr:secretin N-terminal domain-containing protein [Brevundimonas variabilis]MBB5745328.1 general secretion pathway protein D [Brevundimonas variabilis]